LQSGIKQILLNQSKCTFPFYNQLTEVFQNTVPLSAALKITGVLAVVISYYMMRSILGEFGRALGICLQSTNKMLLQ
jgi:hypothetical protein